MRGNEQVPASPAEIVTARQLARYLAAHVRRRTQEAVVNAINRMIAQRTAPDLKPLTRVRISTMENAGTTLPDAGELRFYLYGCGRPELVDVLEPVRRRLERELVEFATAGGPAGSARVPVAFASLPAEAGFTGRADLLAELASVLAPDAEGVRQGAEADDAGPVAICSIAGLAGVGKTALAVHAAHRAVAEGWFPGAVLFVDLRSYDEDGGVEPGMALAALLGGLGLAPAQIPGTQGEREAVYRSELARWAGEGRRVLIVADNAADLRQVVPLRPGTATHRMLVTSRETLPVPGARRIEVGVLPEREAIDVVARALERARSGDRRVAADQEAAAELVALCGHLPLALRIAAELLADKPDLSVRRFDRILSATRDRLGEFDHAGPLAVRTAFEATYRRLPAGQAEVFRLAALHPGQYISIDAMAALAGRDPDATRRLLDALQRAHLMQSATVRTGYQFHDLVRLYARERCDAEVPPDDREAAIGRLLDYYCDGTKAAASYLDSKVRPEDRSDRFDDVKSAVAWIEDERPNLIAAIDLAAGTGRDRHACDTALSLAFFYNTVGWRTDEWERTALAALAAAERLGDLVARSRALNVLCVVNTRMRRLETALDFAGRAFAAARALADRDHQARILLNVGHIRVEQRRFDAALDQFRRALPMLRDLGDASGQGQCLSNIAFVCAELGRLGEAADSYQRSEEIFGGLRDRFSLAVVATNAGDLYRRLGRLDEAVDLHLGAVADFRDLHDHLHEGRALHNLAVAYHAMRRFDEALQRHDQALAARREAGDRHGEAATLAAMADTHLAVHQADKALDCLRRAQIAFVEANDDAEAEKVRDRIAEL
jgi:tetratricopeptide (TPR) repeat protein